MSTWPDAAPDPGPDEGPESESEAGPERHSPLVRRLAEEFGVDLSTIEGTGPGGRITRQDVQTAAFGAEAAAALGGEQYVDPPDRPEPPGRTTPPMPHPPPAGQGGDVTAEIPLHLTKPETEPPSTAVEPVASAVQPMDPGATRQQLSERQRMAMAGLNRAKTVPQFSATVDVDVDQLLRARERLVTRTGSELPRAALFIRLALPVLDEFPQMNAMLDGDELLAFKRRDVGLGYPTANGLQIPVVRQADQLPLAQLGQAVHELLDRAERDELAPSEVGGQTFTLIDAGAVGTKSLTPMLPLATTTVVAYGQPQPVVRLLDDGAREVQVMTITGTFDHRVVDPVEAASFLSTLASYLEDPILAFAN